MIARVSAERNGQIARWGSDDGKPDEVFALILTEEVGEAARATPRSGLGSWLVSDLEALHGEVVQVAAVAVAWLEEINRRMGVFDGAPKTR